MKRRALVTGGSGALGSAICRALARDACEVIVLGNRNAEAAEKIAQEIRAAGGEARSIAFDVTDRAAVRAALEPLTDEEPVQVLVNNAGIHDDAPFPGMSEEQWHGVIDVSLHGFFNVTQALALPMGGRSKPMPVIVDVEPGCVMADVFVIVKVNVLVCELNSQTTVAVEA